VGELVSIVGAEFLPSTLCTVSIKEIGLSSEIMSDAAGYFGTDDVADHAVATLTSDATNVTDADTVTIGSVTYRFKDTMAAVNDVKRGATAAETLANLKATINLTGTAGTHFFAGTVIHPTVTALTLTATTLLLYAKTGGTGGNSLASTEASTHLTFAPGGATFAGGAAASGVSAMLLDFETPGTYDVEATDGTNTATTSIRVWTG